MNIKGKKIALICPKFYGYENLIVEELTNNGATVYLIFENIDWVKVSYRFVYVYLPKYKKKLVESYYIKELKGLLADLDIFAVIRGSSLTPATMEWVKQSVPKTCKFVMYQWDGIKNNNTILEIKPYFDRISTFDIIDAQTEKWRYLPLFFVPKYTKPNEEKDIDILFICALHSKRAAVMNQLKKIAVENKYNVKLVVHLNRFLYYKYKYISKKAEVLEADTKDMTFKPLSIKESYDLYARSKVVVDYTNINQTGYTMRTIESFGNRCKLVTNNELIKQADFYNTKNIHVYDEGILSIPEGFVEEEYKECPKNIYEKYSLHNWLNEIIGEL